MLCSAQTARSGSNWLDRLRSSKGIPTGDDLDLDSFLLSAHSHSPQARPKNPPPARPPDNHDQPMSALLAELFNVGAALTKTSKKCPRKQTNPKIFIASSVANSRHTDAAVAAPSVDAAVPVEEEAVADRCEEEEVENEKEGNELKGFSKSEVTVIDTSCPGWKVDKLVFRKNSVWKVRERKPKNKLFAKRKSNSNLVQPHLDINGIGSSKDSLINIGEKPVKTQKEVFKEQETKEIDDSRLQGSPDRSSKK